MAEIEHPQFNFASRPDPGGTSYDFTRQFTRDDVIFYKREGEKTISVELPGEKSFIAVTLAEGLSGQFFFGFYKYTGELMGARIHFKRYCEQKGFWENANPTDQLIDAYELLKERNEDIIFYAGLDYPKIIVSHVKYITDRKMEFLSVVQLPFPQNGEELIQMEPSDTDYFIPVTFSVNFKDNILSLGIETNPKTVAQDSVSAIANPKELNIYTNPGQLKRFLDNVFVKA